MALGKLLACAALGVAAMAGTASAQMTAGEVEYQQACASCHGMSGKGDGPVAPALSVAVPDLTQIRTGNDGAFPFFDVMQMIDGRFAERQPAAHGGSMPIWGSRFMAQSMMGSSDDPDAIVTGEINTLGRITSLVYYLESIQE